MYATLALALLAFCVHSEASSLRIIGGENADPGDYPFYAQILMDHPDEPGRFKLCGGTIIYERFVLTAWHCVAVDSDHPKKGIAEPERFRVLYNVVNRCKKVWKEVEVEKVIPYPGFLTNPMMHDIALLRLKKAPKIAPSPYVVLPSKYENPDVGVKGVSIGFGRTSPYNDELSCVLKQLDMKIVEPSYSCQESSLITFCALESGYDEPSNDCNGDSGGPWLQSNDDYSDTDGRPGSYTLWGITSEVEKDSCIPHDGWGTSFVDVSKYVDWINRKTGNVF